MALKLWNSRNQKEFSIILYLTTLPQSPFLIHLSNTNLELHSSVSQKQIASLFSAPSLQLQNWSGPLVWKLMSAWSGNAQPEEYISPINFQGQFHYDIWCPYMLKKKCTNFFNHAGFICFFASITLIIQIITAQWMIN